jgi:hypothetical protein
MKKAYTKGQLEREKRKEIIKKQYTTLIYLGSSKFAAKLELARIHNLKSDRIYKILNSK